MLYELYPSIYRKLTEFEFVHDGYNISKYIYRTPSGVDSHLKIDGITVRSMSTLSGYGMWERLGITQIVNLKSSLAIFMVQFNGDNFNFNWQLELVCG